MVVLMSRSVGWRDGRPTLSDCDGAAHLHHAGTPECGVGVGRRARVAANHELGADCSCREPHPEGDERLGAPRAEAFGAHEEAVLPELVGNVGDLLALHVEAHATQRSRRSLCCALTQRHDEPELPCLDCLPENAQSKLRVTFRAKKHDKYLSHCEPPHSRVLKNTVYCQYSVGFALF